jgi:methylated-DNA-[protein]-cysteine S-methyltransferase
MFFLYTDNFDRDYAHMAKHNVAFTEEPRLEEFGKVVVFADKYGNKWDFIERKGSVIMTSVLGYEIKTPWGPIATFVDVTKEPVVIGAAFSEIPKFLKKSGHKLNIVEFKSDAKLAGVTSVVKSWVDGDLDAFKSLKVRQPGGEFTQDVWAALRKVKGGQVISYADLAAKAGRPLAVRAAGTAMATNLIAPIVPCHRVVKTGGAVGNYGFGIDLKIKLLAHEGWPQSKVSIVFASNLPALVLVYSVPGFQS